VCRYCDWVALERIVLTGKKLEEFVCQRHLLAEAHEVRFVPARDRQR
jgi:hypothetical protein